MTSDINYPLVSHCLLFTMALEGMEPAPNPQQRGGSKTTRYGNYTVKDKSDTDTWLTALRRLSQLRTISQQSALQWMHLSFSLTTIILVVYYKWSNSRQDSAPHAKQIHATFTVHWTAWLLVTVAIRTRLYSKATNWRNQWLLELGRSLPSIFLFLPLEV